MFLCCVLLFVADCYNLESMDTWCNMWASDGECVNNYPYMYSHCRRACLNCDGNTG